MRDQVFYFFLIGAAYLKATGIFTTACCMSVKDNQDIAHTKKAPRIISDVTFYRQGETPDC